VAEAFSIIPLCNLFARGAYEVRTRSPIKWRIVPAAEENSLTPRRACRGVSVRALAIRGQGF